LFCSFSPVWRRLLVSGCTLLSPCLAAAASLPYTDLAVLVLAPLEGRAVVQGADGELHLLAVGDALPGAAAKVVRILPDRLVLEEAVPEKPSLRRTIWLYRERLADGRTRVQVLDPERPARPPVLRPAPSAPQQLPPRPGVKTVLPPKEQPKHEG
jgi:hypothetical protein